jgi:hypothetical protein
MRDAERSLRCALALAWLSCLAWAGPSFAQEPAPQRVARTERDPTPPLTLADARAKFDSADLDHDALLARGELAGAGLTESDLAWVDRDGDGAVKSDEYVGALPLLLARSGRRASPELEAEAIRLRTLGAPAPARTGTASSSATTGAGGAARARLVSAVRAQSAPTEAPRPRETGIAPGPASERLRATPTGPESEARLQAARQALAERLLRSADTPPAAQSAVPDTLSGQRRAARDAEPNDSSTTATRLRAARQKLEERIRGARDVDATPRAEPPAKVDPDRRGVAPEVDTQRSRTRPEHSLQNAEAPAAGAPAPSTPPGSGVRGSNGSEAHAPTPPPRERTRAKPDPETRNNAAPAGGQTDPPSDPAKSGSAKPDAPPPSE